MKISHPYTRFDIDPQSKKIFPGKKYIFQPRIRFRIQSPESKKKLLIEGIIDSGAEYCFLNHEIADCLDISIKNGESMQVCGVGGYRIAYFHPVKFEFLFGLSKDSVKYDTSVGFFSKENGYQAPCLLGEYGFFNYFKVSFNLPQHSFEIESAFH